MEARYLILARYAEFTGDGLVNIIGGDTDKLIADEYPYVHPLLLAAARVALDRSDCEQEHKFEAVIVDGDTNDVIADGVSSTLPPLVMPAEASLLGTGLILPFRAVIFPQAGIYIVRLFVDGIVIANTRLRVAPIAYYRVRPVNRIFKAA